MAPQRTCIACRRKGDQSSFLRVSRLAGRRVVVWEPGREAGRSAYLCRRDDCIEKGLEKDRLTKALKVPVGPEHRAELRTELLCKLR